MAIALLAASAAASFFETSCAFTVAHNPRRWRGAESRGPASAAPRSAVAEERRRDDDGGTILPDAAAPLVGGDRRGADADAELWLDLRGTAITPRAALSHLNDDLWGDFAPPPGREGIVSRVLVSEDVAGRVLQNMDEEDSSGGPLDVFFVDDDDNTIRSVRNESIVFGRLFTLEEGEIADPLPALDTVSTGGWSLVDADGIKDEAKRGDAVTSLVEFLSAGASSTGGFLLGRGESLVIGGEDTSETDEGTAGGVALGCRSKTDLLRWGALIRSVNSGGSLMTTESGVLVRQQDSDEQSAKSAEHAPFRSAIVIPFDANLWKTASFIFGDFAG